MPYYYKKNVIPTWGIFILALLALFSVEPLFSVNANRPWSIIQKGILREIVSFELQVLSSIPWLTVASLLFLHDGLSNTSFLVDPCFWLRLLLSSTRIRDFKLPLTANFLSSWSSSEFSGFGTDHQRFRQHAFDIRKFFDLPCDYRPFGFDLCIIHYLLHFACDVRSTLWILQFFF